MPPWPNNSRISSSGNLSASCVGDGGTNLLPGDGLSIVGASGSDFGWLARLPASLSNPAATRHLGHIPAGASSGSSAPHFGQYCGSFITGLQLTGAFYLSVQDSSPGVTCFFVLFTERGQ